MVRVDKKKCIGCGSCVAVCPDVFEMDDDGKARVKSGVDLKSSCILDAIKSCPVEAISK